MYNIQIDILKHISLIIKGRAAYINDNLDRNVEQILQCLRLFPIGTPEEKFELEKQKDINCVFIYTKAD
jgi:hypothetical protein